MNTPETINIEKYAHALNNLIGVDSAYLAGDKDVDAIVEVIVAAKKLENMVKELTEDNDRYKRYYFHHEYDKWAAEIKTDTVRKMQEKIRAKSEYGTINISTWQLDQIVKEMLEENK